MKETLDEYRQTSGTYWPPVDPNPFGFVDRPFFAVETSYHRGNKRTTIVTRQDYGGEALTIGSDGMNIYADENCIARLPFGIPYDSHPDMPDDGWEIKSIHCDQTGGFCMVDVYRFENGWCATVTDESAILWRSFADYDEGLKDSGVCEVAYC